MTTTLCLTPYTPNINDPRIKKRIKTVLDWCGPLLLSKKRPRSIHNGEIRKVFGNVSKPLGRWLSSNLLVQTGSYTPAQHSYSYILNDVGYDKLCSLVNVKTATSAEVAVELYAPIIKGDEVPVYTDKGGRRYHPIQNVRRDDKRILFNGWWDYDIDSCAATLVHQYAKAHYGKSYPEVVEPFPAVARYINEKNTVRQHLATTAGVPQEQAKELSQMLLFLAPLTPHQRCSIYRLLGEDVVRLERLKKDAFVRQLVAELKMMWRYAILADLHERRTQQIFVGAMGANIKEPPAKKAKYRQAIFIGLERKVMDAIHTWFGTEQFPGILMHDGFISRRNESPDVIEHYVLTSTGYKISISKEHLAF
ncbi:hypothetical protein GJ698_06410 [Pseudoduganella sp. FT26W]|uniref:Uncharacterized protein n=1 Tax=Duganella aquatilis TaxID=2666082 RepID=A0A844D1S1_9BURK|nr:hypothetical protein [Duganella aquatilis]MRW83725.1 hypothetical protein [Duganella aquatilis]